MRRKGLILVTLCLAALIIYLVTTASADRVTAKRRIATRIVD